MSDFDILAARKAGYTDPEIEQYLLLAGGRSPQESKSILDMRPEMSKEQFQGLQSKQAPALPPLTGPGASRVGMI